MKRIFYATVVLLFIFTARAAAQDVFNSVMESAQKSLKDPVQNFAKKKFAQFKIDELNYLKSKAGSYETIKRNNLLDIQAYYMSEFLSRYLTEIIYLEGQPDSTKKAMMYLFVNASAMCPLFNDTNKEKTDKYLNADKPLTPFCLDTDWEKAFKFLNKAME